MPDFNIKRETTLGPYSVPAPEELGDQCKRFISRALDKKKKAEQAAAAQEA
jgi:hypothetical protein